MISTHVALSKRILRTALLKRLKNITNKVIYCIMLFRKLTQKKNTPQASPKYPPSRIAYSEDRRFLHDHERNGRGM